MKFLIIAVALIAAVAADVSHLNTMYLPPHQAVGAASTAVHHHTAYVQQVEQAQQAEESVPAAIGADTFTPAHLIEQQQVVDAPIANVVEEFATNTIEEPVSAPVHYVQHEQHHAAHFNIGADTYTPSHLVEQEQQQQHQQQYTIPSVTYSQQIAQAAPVAQYVQQAQAQVQAHTQQYQAAASSGIDTQYGVNGGYVY